MVQYLSRRSTVGVLLISLLWQAFERPALAATQIHNQTVSPVTITFLGNDPDSPTLTVPVTVTFRTTAGANNKTWQLDLQATSGANMASCPSTIPVSKVQVSCTSTSVTNGGTGVCGAPFNLSTGLQTIASGFEGTGNATPYTVVINFTFNDSWRYIATNTSCTVSLNYQITAN
jgi:hypothetical protein